VFADTHRLRRMAALLAASVLIGLTVHGVCQAIEHGHGAQDALVVCGAALALAATLVLVGRGPRRRDVGATRWFAPAQLVPLRVAFVDRRSSAVWLQRFQN